MIIIDEWTSLSYKCAKYIMGNCCKCFENRDLCLGDVTEYSEKYIQYKRFGGMPPENIGDCKENIQSDVNVFLDHRITTVMEREQKRMARENTISLEEKGEA